MGVFDDDMAPISTLDGLQLTGGYGTGVSRVKKLRNLVSVGSIELRTGTWNVRGMYEAGLLKTLETKARKHSLKLIVGIQKFHIQQPITII